jgi:hypothetical protein
VFAHGYLLVGGEKMSKTALNQNAPDDLVADFGLDPYRDHFLADCPVGADTDFIYEGMVARYNADLANNLGNLLSRVATVVGSKCGGVGPAPSDSSPLLEAAAIAAVAASASWSVQPSGRSPRPGSSSGRRTPTWRPTSRGRPSPAPPSSGCWAALKRCASWRCWRRQPPGTA